MLAWLICHKVAYLDAVFCVLQHMTVHLPGWKLHPICTFGNVAPPEQLNCKVCSGRNEKPHSEGFWVAKHTAHKHPHYPAWEPPGLGLSPVWQQSYLSLHEGFHGCYYQCICWSWHGFCAPSGKASATVIGGFVTRLLFPSVLSNIMILAAVCNVALWDPHLKADLMHILKLSKNAAIAIAITFAAFGLVNTGHVNKLSDAVNFKCMQLELHEGWCLLSLSPLNIYVSVHQIGQYNRTIISSLQSH